MIYFYAVASALLLTLASAHAQTTAFTYQGRLNDGTNLATGLYDFRFQVYTAAVGGTIASVPRTNAPVGVTNGLFLVMLDFGNIFDGSTRALEIAVRGYGNTNAYTVLAPRQPFTSTPHAIQALNAATAVNLTAPLQATNLTGTISDARLSANVALRNGNQTFSGGNVFSGTVTATNPANVFAGNGYGLTNVAGTNLVGTIPDARLSTNVPLRNISQTFSGANIFSGSITATNPANIFAGNGYGLTNIAGTNLVGTIPDVRLSANVPLQNGGANFAGTVNAQMFAGSGYGLTNVPGAFFWVTVSGTTIQAQPNVGYITTNDVTPVTITLPMAPNPGDVYKVAGAGAAGWVIAQNAGQSILSGNLSQNIGQSWKTNGPLAYWTAVASSSDGSKLAATINSGQIYVSTDSGVTWTGRGIANFWSAIACSADGTKWVATVGNSTGQTGYIYTSSDSGASWTARYGLAQWVSCASSADGTKLAAVAYNGQIHTSGDSGVNWTARESSRFWKCVASSADGTKLVVGASGGYLYTSTNSGVNWTQRGSAKSWTAVASSADGTRLVAAASADQVYVSTDSGVNWTPSTPAVSATWTCVALSADGSHLAAAYNGLGSIYTSKDSGETWLQRLGAPVVKWSGIATSADGSKLVAVSLDQNGNYIYISSGATTTSGTAGYITGTRLTAIELMYVGNGLFLPLNHEGTIRAY